MPVPERIRQESAAADAELRRLAEQSLNPVPQVVPAGSPTNPPAPPEPRDLDTLPPGDTPHPNAVTPPEQPEGEPVTGEAYAELLQKYETLQGLHNKDQQKLTQTETRVEMLERILHAQAAARAAEPPAPAPAAPAPRQPKPLVTPAEIEEFGADLTDFARRVAREEFMPAVEDLLDQVQQLQTKLANLNQTVGATAQVAASTAEDRFRAEMDKLVQGADGTPDWEKVNYDQNFIDWLQNVGQDSDEPRKAVLERAYQRKDAQKCAGFFNAYKREQGLPVGREAPSTPPAPPPDPAASLVSPSPVAPAAPGSNRGQKKTYKLSDIEKVYADYTKGKFKGKEAEFHALTAEFDKATLEGRVIK